MVNVFKPEEMMNFNGELGLDDLLLNLGEEIELKKKITRKSCQGEKTKAKKISNKSSLTDGVNEPTADDAEARDGGQLWSEAEDEETGSKYFFFYTIMTYLQGLLVKRLKSKSVKISG